MKNEPTSAFRAATHILEASAKGTLTKDPAKLAKYIETECGIPWLAAACQKALTLDAVSGEAETQIRGALAFAGFDDE